MIDLYADEDLLVLRALVDELRSRLPAMNERQYQDVGMWMLKAFWHGKGEPPAVVFEMPDYDRKPTLTLVK